MHFPGLSHSCLGSWRRLAWACVLCPSQVQAAQATRCLGSALPGWAVRLITSLVPATWFPGRQRAHSSQVCPVPLLGSGSQAVTLPVGVNHPESQQVLGSNWKPARSLVQDAYLGPRLPLSDSGCTPPASLSLAQDGPVHSRLALLWYWLSPLFCEWAW